MKPAPRAMVWSVLAALAIVLITLLALQDSRSRQPPVGEEHRREALDPVSDAVTTSIVFHGQARGGELTIFVVNTAVTLKITSGQFMSSIASSVAHTINNTASLRKGGITARVRGNELLLRNVAEDSVFLCATDEGIDIPPSPQQLVATKRPEDDAVVLQWRLPAGGYDRIYVMRGAESYIGVPVGPGGAPLPGTSTNFIDTPQGAVLGSSTYVYRVFGVRNSTPSCAATAKVFLKGR